MKENSPCKLFIIIICDVVYLLLLLVNGLASTGRGPFQSSVGNVSALYQTDITPANWAFSIWGVIYIWLTLMVVFITVGACRGYWALSVLPFGFHICWLLSMICNISWLLLWDHHLMLAALVVLFFLVSSNLGALFFCCLATDYYGMWLQMYHSKTLACLRFLVQNGIGIYATWTCIATLINLCVVLHLWGLEKSTAATIGLCILFALVVTWFILENWVLDRWVRYILTIYPVVCFALIGIVNKHYNPDNPTPNSIFAVILLVVALILMVSRICTVIWRNNRRPLFTPSSTRPVVSPLDSTSRILF